MAWGYLKMFSLNRDETYRFRAEACLRWLMENRSPGQRHYCWGNHFTFTTRAGTIPRCTPTIVWSSLIGLAFLEAYETLGPSNYLEVAASTAEWVKTLPREQTHRGMCLSYVPFAQSSIHNSNMLGGALLARVASHTHDEKARQFAREAMYYSCSRQLADGGWYYGDAEKYHWIDNFHTGYNLDCLKRYIGSTGDEEFEENLEQGFKYYAQHFFEADGTPRYYSDRTQPIDIQCAAQSIDTLAFFSEGDLGSLDLASRVARWTVEHMQGPDGHFYYRDLGWKKIKTAMFHWGQGTMFKALAHLLAQMTREESRRPETLKAEVHP